ncbi:MAG: hypothetical protein R2688_09020 [Fimbriimonadaceae bacterium]
MRLHAEECLLIVVDMQPSFLGGVVGVEVMKRTKFLVEVRNQLQFHSPSFNIPSGWAAPKSLSTQ